MTTKHLRALTIWAARTPEVRRIFAYTKLRRQKKLPAGVTPLAIEVAPLRSGAIPSFSLWVFDRSLFWAAIFNNTPGDFQFELEGFYPEYPEVVENVERTGELIYSAESTFGE